MPAKPTKHKPKFRVGQVVSVRCHASTDAGVKGSHSRSGWYHGWAFGRILKIHYPTPHMRRGMFVYMLDGWMSGQCENDLRALTKRERGGLCAS